MNKHLIISLSVLVLLILGYFYYEEGGSSGEKHWKALDKEVDRVVLINNDGYFEMVKKDHAWSFNWKKKGEDAFSSTDLKASKEKVEEMLVILTRKKRFDLISRHKVYSPYGIDKTNRISLEVFSGETNIRKIWIGKTSSSLKHSYVLLKEDGDVYQVSGDFKDTVDLTKDDLRDKDIIVFNRRELISLDISENGKSTTIVRHREEKAPQTNQESDPPTPEVEEYWKDDEGNKLDEEKVDALVNTLSSLQAESFLDLESGEMKGKIQRVFTVKTSTFTSTLTMFKKEDEKHLASVSDQKNGFELSEGSAEELLVELKSLKSKDLSK